MAIGTYYIKHNMKVQFFMPGFSISELRTHIFHIKNEKGETGIGYHIIVAQYIMVQLGIIVDFNIDFL